MGNILFGSRKSRYPNELGISTCPNCDCSEVMNSCAVQTSCTVLNSCAVQASCALLDSCPLLDCCASFDSCHKIRHAWSNREPPQLGYTRSGRPVTPHRCYHQPSANKLQSAPSSSSVRSKSASSLSIRSSRSRTSRRPSRASIKSQKCASSTTRHEPEFPPFKQFKSPTTPKYRPVVKPHNCFDHEKRPRPSGMSALLKWLMLALVLVGVAGAAAGPLLLNKAKKKCQEVNPCR